MLNDVTAFAAAFIFCLNDHFVVFPYSPSCFDAGIFFQRIISEVT